MSWDRVLPAPAGLHYDSTQVRPSNLLDHKIMNELPKAHGPLAYRPEPVKYADIRPSGVTQAHQQMACFSRPKSAIPKIESDEFIQEVRSPGPMVSTRDHSRSSSSSGSTSPVRSKERQSFCLCQPDPKVPRPRNGESMLSAPLFNEHGKCL